MNWKIGQPLREGMITNPVVHAEYVDMTDIILPTDEQLAEIFTTGKPQLKTWGRSSKNPKIGPHWIGVRGSTPMHFDPAYPRYTHHLKIRVDEGISCRGIDMKEKVLERGLFYILDAHSPHQILSKDRLAYNISVSVDSPTMLDPAFTIMECLHYARNAPFLAEIYK